MLRQKQLRQLIAVQRLVRHMATQRRLLVGPAGWDCSQLDTNSPKPGKRYPRKSGENFEHSQSQDQRL